jgi:aryl-alcohol dehydrogenase-like predicted oxidoreductase
MRYRQLGRTSLTVSRLCLGAWQFGGDWGGFEMREAQAVIRQALELGVNFFDTAQAYGFGKSERVLGEALRPELRSRRDKVILPPRAGCGWKAALCYATQAPDGCGRASNRVCETWE